MIRILVLSFGPFVGMQGQGSFPMYDLYFG